MAEKPVESVEKKSSNRRNIIIAFLTILLVINGVKLYMDNQKSKQLESQLEMTTEELDDTYKKLSILNTELDLKIEEINRLGGDVSELRQVKEELENERNQLRNQRRISDARLKEIQGKVEGYETLLKEKDEEIIKLKETNEALFSENVGLKTEKNVLSDSIRKIAKTSQALEEKVVMASQLKAENIKIAALNSRGREREGEFRNRQIEKLKVDFNLAENKVASIGGRDIHIRVIDPSGDVLFDVAAGAGTFIIDGKEQFFTAKQEILFDNTKQKLSFIYEKGTDYSTGKHTVEIYEGVMLIGRDNFTVK